MEIGEDVSKSNIVLMQIIQSKLLISIVSASYYVPNEIIHSGLSISKISTTVKDSSRRQQRLENHSTPSLLRFYSRVATNEYYQKTERICGYVRIVVIYTLTLI